MDDLWCGICGTLWPYWWRGPHGPGGPPVWMRLVAGFIGGIGAWEVFGPTVGAGGGAVALTLIGVAGGNFLAVVVDAGFGMMRGNAAQPGA